MLTDNSPKTSTFLRRESHRVTLLNQLKKQIPLLEHDILYEKDNLSKFDKDENIENQSKLNLMVEQDILVEEEEGDEQFDYEELRAKAKEKENYLELRKYFDIPEEEKREVGKLIIFSGASNESDIVFPLTTGITLIGREESCDIVLQNIRGISGFHAIIEISISGNICFVEDIKSTNGISIGGTDEELKLFPQKCYQLLNENIFYLGPAKCMIELKPITRFPEFFKSQDNVTSSAKPMNITQGCSPRQNKNKRQIPISGYELKVTGYQDDQEAPIFFSNKKNLTEKQLLPIIQSQSLIEDCFQNGSLEQLFGLHPDTTVSLNHQDVDKENNIHEEVNGSRSKLIQDVSESNRMIDQSPQLIDSLQITFEPIKSSLHSLENPVLSKLNGTEIEMHFDKLASVDETKVDSDIHFRQTKLNFHDNNHKSLIIHDTSNSQEEQVLQGKSSQYNQQKLKIKILGEKDDHHHDKFVVKSPISTSESYELIDGSKHVTKDQYVKPYTTSQEILPGKLEPNSKILNNLINRNELDDGSSDRGAYHNEMSDDTSAVNETPQQQPVHPENGHGNEDSSIRYMRQTGSQENRIITDVRKIVENIDLELSKANRSITDYHIEKQDILEDKNIQNEEAVDEIADDNGNEEVELNAKQNQENESLLFVPKQNVKKTVKRTYGIQRKSRSHTEYFQSSREGSLEAFDDNNQIRNDPYKNNHYDLKDKKEIIWEPAQEQEPIITAAEEQKLAKEVEVVVTENDQRIQMPTEKKKLIEKTSAKVGVGRRRTKAQTLATASPLSPQKESSPDVLREDECNLTNNNCVSHDLLIEGHSELETNLNHVSRKRPSQDQEDCLSKKTTVKKTRTRKSNVSETLVDVPSSKIQDQRVYRIMFSKISDQEMRKQERIIKKLGGKVVNEWHECTHMVTFEFKRTVKLLCTLSSNRFLMTLKWLEESSKAGQFLDETEYMLEAPEAEIKFGFKMKESIARMKTEFVNGTERGTLFKGMQFYTTPSVTPRKEELKELIESNGGTMSKCPRSGLNQDTFIITEIGKDQKDLKYFKDRGFTVYSKESILLSSLKQKLDFDDHIIS